MEILQAIVLGIIQGVGEFLPISSSGHLVLVPWLFNWQDHGLSFDVALHFGTLLAVIIYFAPDWLKIIRAGLTGREDDIYPSKLLWLLALATIPGAMAGYFFEDYAETTFRHPLLIAGTLSVVGLSLYWADKRSQGGKTIQQTSLQDAVVIGLSQALAIVPGVSRAGATITAGLATGFDRINAAKFSFLLSTPIIFGAACLKFDDFLSGGISGPEIAGIISAAVSGYVAIAALLRLISKVSYRIFFWYRLALAAVIVILWFAR